MFVVSYYPPPPLACTYLHGPHIGSCHLHKAKRRPSRHVHLTHRGDSLRPPYAPHEPLPPITRQHRCSSKRSSSPCAPLARTCMGLAAARPHLHHACAYNRTIPQAPASLLFKALLVTLSSPLRAHAHVWASLPHAHLHHARSTPPFVTLSS